MARGRFTRGVFNCRTCGRRTPGVGHVWQPDLCTQCELLLGWDNHHNDNGTPPTPGELRYYESALTKLKERGGDADKVRALCEYIWNREDEHDDA